MPAKKKSTAKKKKSRVNEAGNYTKPICVRTYLIELKQVQKGVTWTMECEKSAVIGL